MKRSASNIGSTDGRNVVLDLNDDSNDCFSLLKLREKKLLSFGQ